MANPVLEGMTLTLSKAVSFGSQEIRELTFAEPTGREMALIKQEMTFGDLMVIAAKLTGQPPRVMDLLAARDVRKVVEHTAFLLAAD